MNEQTLYSITEVARLLKKQPYQVVYVLTTGKVAEPKVRLSNRRAFGSDEIEMLRDYFYPSGDGSDD